jgi:LuxR family transcriptional regulator
MESQGIEQLDKMSVIRCEHSLFDQVGSFSRDLGFDCCTFVLRMPLPLTRRNITVFSDCPAVSGKALNQEEYLRHGTRVINKIDSVRPPVLPVDCFDSVGRSCDGSCFCGLSIGWAHTNRNSNGVVGTLMLGRNGAPLSKNELQDRELSLLRLAQITHMRMSQILTTSMMPEARVKLTEREIEVLRWTADGKTSAETSEILNITERTVNFHIANAMTKLNSSSKTAAVVRAVALGLLTRY